MLPTLVAGPTPDTRVQVPRTGPPAHATRWAAELGASWRVELLALLVLIVAGGSLRSLGDADLPMHLATGEWIARHHAVPTVEPFAWTAVGEPFYSHSWGPQLLFYVVFAALGPLGLRFLNGLLLATAAAAAGALGRARHWPPGVTLAMSAGNVLAAALVTIGLRPQLLMFTLVPLSWAITSALAYAARTRLLCVALFAVGVVAVNSHLFFPLIVAPAFALCIAGELPVRRAAVVASIVALSWVVTPYALAWPRMLAFMGAHGAIFRYPSPIAELVPGFVWLTISWLSPLWVVVLPLLTLPWVLAGEAARVRLAAGLYWTVGLAGFAVAQRLVVVWWLLTFPFVGWVLSAKYATSAPSQPARPAVKWLVYGVGALALGFQLWALREDFAAEGTVATRRLSTEPARAVQPLADWLVANTRPHAAGRIFTGFDYGGYLTWRLPGYSASVDSRGSFADSLLAPETFVIATTPHDQLGPWRAADLAVVPIRWRVASVLDTASGWRRTAAATATRAPKDTIGLWVRSAWWDRVGRGPLPAVPVFLVESRQR